MAVICRKRGAFDHAGSPDSTFNLVKTRVKDRADLISMDRGALVIGFVNMSVYFSKLGNNF